MTRLLEAVGLCAVALGAWTAVYFGAVALKARWLRRKSWPRPVPRVEP